MSLNLSGAIFSKGIQRIAYLEVLANCENFIFRPSAKGAKNIGAVYVWGNKASAAVGICYAKQHNKSLIRLEDGFFRSIRGGQSEMPLSLIVDHSGIYYDARTASDLEKILQGVKTDDPLDDPVLLERAARLLQGLRQEPISKYNDGSLWPSVPLAKLIKESAEAVSLGKSSKAVLILDQTYGDASVRDGLTPDGAFEQMVQHALEHYPNSPIWIKSHPDVIQGRKKGYLSPQLAEHPRIEFIAEHISPHLLFESVSTVLTATSQLGFEALLQGKEVLCFGAPFYSGWGLTQDFVEVPRRTKRRTLQQLFAAACLLYPNYRDPLTGEACEAERVIEHLMVQRRRFKKNVGVFLCVGISHWKRDSVRRFLSGPGSIVHFCSPRKLEKRLSQIEPSHLVVWGQKISQEVLDKLAKEGLTIERMEDGFLRSSGLGSDLTAPASLVLDPRGIYYDPSRPSALEERIEQLEFSQMMLERAANLRRQIVEMRVSKYNVQQDQSLNLEHSNGRKIILIVGQVDDDASLRLGCDSRWTDKNKQKITTNAELVEWVRKEHPDAFLVFKPHPDVLSGNRIGKLDEKQNALLDHIETEHSLAACLDAVEEVHTLTSLVGFEALIRRLPVHCYGLPFYAGYGLTQDYLAIPRRKKRLLLDELVYAALIDYPVYYHHGAQAFAEAEDIVNELARQGSSQLRDPSAASMKRQIQRLGRFLRGLADA